MSLLNFAMRLRLQPQRMHWLRHTTQRSYLLPLRCPLQIMMQSVFAHSNLAAHAVTKKPAVPVAGYQQRRQALAQLQQAIRRFQPASTVSQQLCVCQWLCTMPTQDVSGQAMCASAHCSGVTTTRGKGVRKPSCGWGQMQTGLRLWSCS